MTPSTRARPTVGVIIPAFNAEATLADTVATLQRQTHDRWEAVIVDDGSTDRTADVALKIARSDPRVRVTHQRNAGASAARNRGIDLLACDLVAFLDADDAYLPHALQTLVDAAARADLPAACGGYRVRCAGGETIAECRPSPGRLGFADVLQGTHPWTCSQIIARSVLGETRFDPSLVGYEDLDLWLRLAGSGLAWAATEDVVAEYHVRPGSLSKRSATMISCGQHAILAAGGSKQVDPRVVGERLQHVALAHATAHAVAAPDAVLAMDEAARMYAGAQGPKMLDPRKAAVVGHFAAMVATATSVPRDAVPPWLDRLVDWWERCEADGWGERGFARQAFLAETEHLVSPDDVCDEIIAQCHNARRIVVLGAGQNGRLFIERARRAGLQVEARDDRFDGPAGLAARQRALDLDVPILDVDAPLPHGAAVVVTPLQDASLVSRFAHARPIRWSLAREAVAVRRSGLVRLSGPGTRSARDRGWLPPTLPLAAVLQEALP